MSEKMIHLRLSHQPKKQEWKISNMKETFASRWHCLVVNDRTTGRKRKNIVINSKKEKERGRQAHIQSLFLNVKNIGVFLFLLFWQNNNNLRSIKAFNSPGWIILLSCFSCLMFYHIYCHIHSRTGIKFLQSTVFVLQTIRKPQVQSAGFRPQENTFLIIPWMAFSLYLVNKTILFIYCYSYDILNRQESAFILLIGMVICKPKMTPFLMTKSAQHPSFKDPVFSFFPPWAWAWSMVGSS